MKGLKLMLTHIVLLLSVELHSQDTLRIAPDLKTIILQSPAKKWFEYTWFTITVGATIGFLTSFYITSRGYYRADKKEYEEKKTKFTNSRLRLYVQTDLLKNKAHNLWELKFRFSYRKAHFNKLLIKTPEGISAMKKAETDLENEIRKYEEVKSEFNDKFFHLFEMVKDKHGLNGMKDMILQFNFEGIRDYQTITGDLPEFWAESDNIHEAFFNKFTSPLFIPMQDTLIKSELDAVEPQPNLFDRIVNRIRP